jgi:hypothetical protein
LLYEYFSQPDYEAIRESVSKKGLTQIEVCGDICDFFALPRGKHGPEVWDLILMFEVFVSPINTYDDFRRKHAEYAQALLARYLEREKSCATKADDRGRATCILSRAAKSLRIQYAQVRYDEGNRCAAYSRFDDLEKVIKSKCTSVMKE